tara:strand:+ start:242 stop:577 length:336 start_codon:yes stop_codon:yes gene_type:complete
MKNLIYFLLLLLPFSSNVENKTDDISYDLTVLHLNANWNKSNAVPIDKLIGCNLEWALLEEQSSAVKEKFSKIPVIALKNKGEPVRVWEGNIMFEATVTVEEIQKVLDSLR